VTGGGWTRWRDEISRIRYRLLSINLLIVSVPLLGLGFARFYEREMLRLLEEDMIHQAAVLREVVLHDPSGAGLESFAPLLAAAARETRTRVRLLDERGAIRADSHAGGPPEGTVEGDTLARSGIAPQPVNKERDTGPADVSTRKEVIAALGGSYGAMSRIWRFEGGQRVYLFSALPIVAARQSEPAAARPSEPVAPRSVAPDADRAVRGVVYITRSTLPVVAAMHRLRATLWRVLWGAFAVTAVLTLFLAATISTPLARLTRVAQRIAGGARVEPMGRDAIGRRDEIGRLARAVDTMAQRLDARAHEMAELAANLSHEFKSPLTSIRGAAELLGEGAADDPEARRLFLANILADAGRLDRLVTRLLELSRAEADTTPIEDVALRDLLVSAIATSRGPAGIDLDYGSGVETVRGRRALLASMVSNLVDNAQRHAAPGSRVTVRTRDDASGAVEIAVHNAGEPISEANLARVWDRFFTTCGDEGGTGLGLPIVESIAKAHGGTVRVESRREAGTTFAVRLPALA
jgi:two-component system sensor histidine kinase ChvG